MCSENNGNFRYLKKIFIYLSTLMLSPSKESVSDIMHLWQRFFQSSKHFSNSIFGIDFSSFSDALLMSSMAVKRRPFKVLFIFGNRKKSHGAMSDEYGGWGIVPVLFLAKNSRTSNEVSAGALSWCKSHEVFFHKSERFFRIASRERRWTYR